MGRPAPTDTQRSHPGLPVKVGDMLIFDPGIPWEEVCNGEPPLKCCKYNPATQEYCHTAFNSEAPINCEGNWTQPFAESYGECIPRNA